MPRKLILTVIAAVLIIGSVPLIAQNQKPVFRIPDQWDMGCVSCHSADVLGETLNVTLSEMDHPNITRSVKELPNGCTVCHRNGTLAPIIHKVHFPAGAGTAEAMPCLACHQMNPVEGMPFNKNAPANW